MDSAPKTGNPSPSNSCSMRRRPIRSSTDCSAGTGRHSTWHSPLVVVQDGSCPSQGLWLCIIWIPMVHALCIRIMSGRDLNQMRCGGNSHPEPSDLKQSPHQMYPPRGWMPVDRGSVGDLFAHSDVWDGECGMPTMPPMDAEGSVVQPPGILPHLQSECEPPSHSLDA